jgi:hypothetical protein
VTSVEQASNAKNTLTGTSRDITLSARMPVLSVLRHSNAMNIYHDILLSIQVTKHRFAQSVEKVSIVKITFANMPKATLQNGYVQS